MLIVALFGGLSVVGWAGLSGALFVGLILMLFFGLFFGLMFGLIGRESIETRVHPNQGIWQSLRNAVVVGLIIGVIVGLAFGLFFGLIDGLRVGLNFGVSVGLRVGLSIGLFFGLTKYGGIAFIQHFVLRFILWCNDYITWNYVQFLDYAAERIFLRKVGGGYIFIHRLLMEHFAAMKPEDINAIVRET